MPDIASWDGMRFLGMLAGACALTGACAAMAMHPVSAPEIWARRHVMEIIGEQTAILEAMAAGRVAFDARAARTAAGEISEYARQVPDLFESEAQHHRPEPLEAIREDFGEFRAQSLRLAALAEAACEEIQTLDDLRSAYANIEQTCRSCHADFRN